MRLGTAKKIAYLVLGVMICLTWVAFNIDFLGDMLWRSDFESIAIL